MPQRSKPERSELNAALQGDPTRLPKRTLGNRACCLAGLHGDERFHDCITTASAVITSA
jgi:hypothetical protein